MVSFLRRGCQDLVHIYIPSNSWCPCELAFEAVLHHWYRSVSSQVYFSMADHWKEHNRSNLDSFFFLKSGLRPVLADDGFRNGFDERPNNSECQE